MIDSSDKPMVSVLVTSYNRGNYIQDAIESILQQTYKDYEIIISDNCSTDNTLELLEKYKSNPKIIIHQNPTNIGQFLNRNKCAELARGKYLKYVDSDDLMYPCGLEILVQSMENFPDAKWGLCSFTQIDEKPFPFVLQPRQAFLYHYSIFPIFNKAPLSAIIRKDVFHTVKGFENLIMAGDMEMWYKLALHYPVVLIQDGIVWYRMHEGQEMVNYNKNVLEYEKVKLNYLQHRLCPLSKSEISEIVKKNKKYALKNWIHNLIQFKFDEAKIHFKTILLFLK